MNEFIEHAAFSEYRVNGKAHRTNGPSTEYAHGDWSWMLFGFLHRYYGPANHYDGWWIHGGFIK